MVGYILASSLVSTIGLMSVIMERHHRQLLSKTSPARHTVQDFQSGLGPLKRRRTHTSVACNECRRRKVRCDGERPACYNCQAQGTLCEYRDEGGLSAESRDLVLEIIATLNELSTSTLNQTLRNLKSEENAVTVLDALRNAKGTDDQFERFANSSASSSDDGIVLNMNGELASQYPAVYPNLTQSDTHLFKKEPYRGLTEPYTTDTTQDSSLRSSYSGASIRKQKGPFPLCDSRLEKLNIRYWTDVPITNDLAARCISLYLETDHPLLNHFDPNLFVSDLTAEQNHNCSSLLVNALLYWACQMYSAIEPQADELALPLCEEAERLWSAERLHGHDSTLNMAAAVFLSLGYLGQGRDHAVLDYLAEVTEMGIRMRLFGVEGENNTDQTNTGQNVQGAETYAAWGVFNWTVLMSLFYHQPGIHIPASAPRTPMPQKISTAPPLSSYMGDVFPGLCRFWEIVHGVGALYHEDGNQPWGSSSSLAFAEMKFRELLAWSNGLPYQLTSQNESPHFVQIMHIWFHAAVLDIFRPIIYDDSQKGRRLRTFTDESYTPQVIYAMSTEQLKRLVVEYRLNYASSSYTILWHTAMIYIANAILEGNHDENWYSYILFCCYGYQRLSKSWRVAKAISKGLLSLAMQKGHLTGDAARSILSDLQSTEELPQDVRATFMLDLGSSSPDSSTVEQLADSFEANAVIQDYTHIFDEPLD